MQFFPRKIEAEYSVWQGNSWRPLADATLDNIKKPPTNPTSNPIYLDDATATQLLSYQGLNTDFVDALTNDRYGTQAGIQRHLDENSSLQDLYDVLNTGMSISMSNKANYKSKSGSERQTIFDTFWWPALERLLKSPPGGRPLRITQGNNASGAVITETARNKPPANAQPKVPKSVTPKVPRPVREFSLDEIIGDPESVFSKSSGGPIRSSFSSRNPPT